MEYDYKKYNHRSKSLKSANTYLTKFIENLELDYDEDAIYDATIKNLLGVKQLCDNISKRIDGIVAKNSKELNEIKYTYLSIANSVVNFKYMNYQAVVNAGNSIDSLINSTVSQPEFSYSQAEELPYTILKLIFICSAQSTDFEYVNYLHSLDIHSLSIDKIVGDIDLGTTSMYALVLYHLLWENKFKSMGKYQGKYYLAANSMYEFISNLGVSADLLKYYDKNKGDSSIIEKVGIR